MIPTGETVVSKRESKTTDLRKRAWTPEDNQNHRLHRNETECPQLPCSAIATRCNRLSSYAAIKLAGTAGTSHLARALLPSQTFSASGSAPLALSALLFRRLLRGRLLSGFLFLGSRFCFLLRRSLFRFLCLRCGRWLLRRGSRRLFFLRGLALDDDLFHLFYDSLVRVPQPFFAFLFVAGEFVIFLIVHFAVKHGFLHEWRACRPQKVPSRL